MLNNKINSNLSLAKYSYNYSIKITKGASLVFVRGFSHLWFLDIAESGIL